MGQQDVAQPFGWRSDRWLHNVQNLSEGDVYEPIGESPNSLKVRRRISRSIETDAKLDG